MAQDKLQQRGQQGRVQTQTKTIPQKRQVRRRLHTTRPYQERLLNMAEARKEIVTALKFHRASMKQQQQTESTVVHDKKQQTPPPPSSTNQCNFYPNSSSTPLSSTITLNNNISILPDQTLGLNLNFQGFTDMDASTLYTQTISSSSYSILQPCFSSSSLSHLSPPLLDSTYNNTLPFFNTSINHLHHHHHTQLSTTEDAKQMLDTSHNPTTENSSTHLVLDGDHQMKNNNNISLHRRGLDDEQMEEIRTIGKRHQIEWNDTINLVNSAWWSKFLNTMESTETLIKGEDDVRFGQESNTYGWQNPTLYYPPGIDNLFDNTTFHADHDLPCMDIEGFEHAQLDEEYWLS